MSTPAPTAVPHARFATLVSSIASARPGRTMLNGSTASKKSFTAAVATPVAVAASTTLRRYSPSLARMVSNISRELAPACVSSLNRSLKPSIVPSVCTIPESSSARAARSSLRRLVSPSVECPRSLIRASILAMFWTIDSRCISLKPRLNSEMNTPAAFVAFCRKLTASANRAIPATARSMLSTRNSPNISAIAGPSFSMNAWKVLSKSFAIGINTCPMFCASTVICCRT